jgi:hypothetical protein
MPQLLRMQLLGPLKTKRPGMLVSTLYLMEIKLTWFVGPSCGHPMQLWLMDEENGETEGGQLTVPMPAPVIAINTTRGRPLTHSECSSY